jgi:acyl carrier protein
LGTYIEETYEAPSTPAEKALAEIWKEILQIDQVSIHDSFFDVGGHSLLATQLMTRLRRFFGISLTLRTLFEKATIAKQAEVIEEELIKEITSL